MSSRHHFWILAISAALLLLAPIRTGDLAGYDDAFYAHAAKVMVQTGDWIDVDSNGNPALEHPPGFEWMQAAVFSLFGFSDPLAKLPSAMCGLGVVLLVYWLARRVLFDKFAALLAMFVMAGSVYFVKYAAHAMTDVPFTFVLVCSICAWLLAQEQPAWYFAVTALTAYALMTRGVAGLAVPLILVLHGVSVRKHIRWRYAAPALAIAFVPLIVWYVHLIHLHGPAFWEIQGNFVKSKLTGELKQPWRRYTGALEYLWMLTKSYWPWLPFLVVALVVTIRKRDARWYLFLIWPAVIFAMCSVGGSRVLRYLLPAYPAFAILVAVGLIRAVPERYLRTGLNILIPAAAVFCAGLALFPRVTWQAAEIRPIAETLKSITAENERIAFYDEGQPRFDETNQLQWYGDRYFQYLMKPEELEAALQKPLARVFVIDKNSYLGHLGAFHDYEIVIESGHLVCIRVVSQ